MNEAVAKVLRSHGADPQAFTASEHANSVISGTVPGAGVLDLWIALRAAHPQTELWPVIRGSADDPPGEYPFDSESALRAVPVGNVRALLTPRFAERREDIAELVPNITDESLDWMTVARMVDESGIHRFRQHSPNDEPWPDEPRPGEPSFHSTHDFRSRQPHPAIGLSLVRTSHPHEIPVHLGFGGWNDAPDPQLQAAVLREWRKEYGAVPACVTGDVLECYVDRPPQTERQAMELAVEMWAFCDDIVSQGTQTVRRLAMEIWRCPRWFFWWD
jgi:hypothetical protein